MDWFRQDLKHSFRRLIRRPGMSALAVLTLAVGLGVNTVAFSAIDAFIFKPFHIPNADKIGWLMFRTPAGSDSGLTVAVFEAIERHATTLDIVAASTRAPLAETSGDSTRQVWALMVSPRFFEMLPADLVIGRGLTADDVTRNNGQDVLTAVVSERYWRSTLGANRDLSALNLELNRQRARVVGVMKDGYQTPTGVFEPELWIPLAAGARMGVTSAASALDRTVGLIAMPKANVTAAAISTDVQRIVASEMPDAAKDLRVDYARVLDGHPEVRSLKPVAAVALAAVGVVLLIACFNVAGLLLAQSVDRQRDLGVRSALGASRGRLVRQVMTDGLLLAGVAGAAALLLARWSAAILGTFALPAPIPQRIHFSTDWRLVTFAALASLLAALLPTLVPAWQVWRTDLTRWIRASASSAVGGKVEARTRRAFLVFQVGASTVFLILAAAFLRSFILSATADAGFDTTRTTVLELDATRYGYTPARARELTGQLIEKIQAIPGVVAVSASNRVPFSPGLPKRVNIDGRDCRTADCPNATVYAVDDQHAAALGLTMLTGRMFDRRKAEDRDGVVITKATADAFWPGQYPIGQSFRDDSGHTWHVTGVAADILTYMLRGVRPRPTLYRPITEEDFSGPVTVVARTSGDAAALELPMRAALREVAPSVPPSALQTMTARMALPLWPTRTLAGFFGACGLVAMLLATVGLFGVTHVIVGQRTREFGVRMAIGASSGTLERMVLGESVRLIAPGVVFGVIVGAGLNSMIKSQLLGLERADARIFAIAVAVEVLVALAAAWMPARRAAATDPLSALRAE